jgi:hypothetical protein
VGIEDVLTAARARLQRLTPEQAAAAQRRGALMIDTRTEVQRSEQGELPGADRRRTASRHQPDRRRRGMAARRAAGAPRSGGRASMTRRESAMMAS